MQRQICVAILKSVKVALKIIHPYSYRLAHSPMHRAFWFIGAVALLFTSVCAQAKEIRICYDKWVPYAYEGRGGAEGLSVDIVRTFMERAGHEVTFVSMPTARCQFSQRYGAVDGILLDDVAHAKSANLKISSDSLASRVTVAVVRSSFLASEYRGPESFEGASWLKVIGDQYPKAIANNPDMHAVEVGENAKGYEMLRRHHVDVVFADLASMRYDIGAQRDAMQFKVLHPALEIAEFYLSLGAETADILGDFNLAMAHGVESGELDNIYYRYLGFSRNGYARYIEHSDGAGTAESNSIEQ